MMHVGRGRAHPLHVEYVHIGVTLSFIQDVLTEALLSHPRLRMDRKIALVKALGKVIWIQNDLFAKWYVRDGDEFEEEMQVPGVEKEGYLHGRKVIHDGSESESEAESTGGGCPFKGMTRDVGRMSLTEEHSHEGDPSKSGSAEIAPEPTKSGVEVEPPATPLEGLPKAARPLSGSGIPRPI